MFSKEKGEGAMLDTAEGPDHSEARRPFLREEKGAEQPGQKLRNGAVVNGRVREKRGYRLGLLGKGKERSKNSL